jgi:hypothetical protein
LPGEGRAKISLQTYHGPTDKERWARFDDFFLTRRSVTIINCDGPTHVPNRRRSETPPASLCPVDHVITHPAEPGPHRPWQ